MSKIIFKISLLLALLVLSVLTLFAQKDTVITQEVEVTKAYRPSISDAFKINETPAIDDEDHQKPTFNYSIFSQPFFSAISVNPLQAAKIAGKPKEDAGYGLIKLGVGNYGKPYADLYLNNNESNNTLFGLHFKHLSSRGKIKLPGGDKVEAPFSDNSAEMFLKRAFRKSNLSFNGAYNRDGFNYYGYPEFPMPGQLLEEGQQINYFGTKQAFSKAAFNFNLESTSKSASAPKLGLDINYHYFSTKTNQQEHQAEVAAHVGKKVGYLTALLDAGAVFYRVDTVFTLADSDFGKRQEIWLKANPAVKFEYKGASFRVGGKFYAVVGTGVDAKIKIAPDVLVNLVPIKGILNIFAGIDGGYVLNSYSKIAYENPFADPFHDVKNTMTQYRLLGGINGKVTSKTTYKVSIEYSSVKDQPFYYLVADMVPDGDSLASITNNTFKVLYDDLGMTKVSLEVYHTANEKLNFLLTGNYYSYNNSKLDEPWNLPAFDAALKAGYQATPRLHVSAEVYLVGKRKAFTREDNDISTGSPDKIYQLGTILDLNAKATYAITGDFSVFAQLNNFGFQNYQRWLGYPVQNLNFLAGVSYSF